jgi:thiamine biosynthesis lipoprotein
MKAVSWALSSLIILTGILGCQERPIYKNNRLMMGTFVEVTSPREEASQIVFNEIKRIEGLLSKYDPESQISRLNKSGKLKVDAEVFYILKKSLEFFSQSQGAFDITVAPLMDLWGFTEKEYTVPDIEKIKKTLDYIGSDKIILQEVNNMVKFRLSKMRVDLGAIAKGYAVDCAVSKLKAAGIKSCLINAGGQIYCLGNKLGKPWKVAIQDPRDDKFWGYLNLEDKAVSTSGDYQQYFFKDNKRYAHILNPKTGYPASSGIASVTVIAPDGLTADALSTAIFILGREKGEALAKKYPETQVKIVEIK